MRLLRNFIPQERRGGAGARPSGRSEKGTLRFKDKNGGYFFDKKFHAVFNFTSQKETTSSFGLSQGAMERRFMTGPLPLYAG